MKPKIDLFPHNQKTFDNVKEILKESNRCAIIQPTGSGKTYLILSILYEYIFTKKALVLAPSKHIVDQIKTKSNGVLPNTEFLLYAGLSRKSKEYIESINPEVIILDEFHRCGAKQWGKGIQTLTDAFPNAIIIGTTATPIRHMDTRNMAEELFGNNIAVDMSLSDAIVKGILPMPKYISALYTIDEEILNLETKINNSKNDEEDKKNMLQQVKEMKKNLDKSKGIPVILKKHLRDIQGGKFIVFCKDKKHLREMKQTVIGWFDKAKLGNEVEPYSVYTGLSGNDKRIAEFRHNKNSENVRLLFCIDKLNEGLHIDDVDGVILLRATASNIIYFQQIGRAIQAGDNTKQPIIFDFVNNFDNVGSGMLINGLNESAEREKKEREENGEEYEIPEFIIHDEVKEINDLFGEMESKLIGYPEEWDAIFKRYKNGEYDENDKKMFNWTGTQRKLRKNGILDESKIVMLDSINFPWNLNDKKFEMNFNLLLRYKEEFGDTLVPRRYLVNEHQLGKWVTRIRGFYKKNKIEKEKVELLNSIGFAWNPKEDNWNENYKLLLNYYHKYGDTLVKSAYEINGVKLGVWVMTQRTRFKINKVTNERIQRLNSIGFKWDMKELSELPNINKVKTAPIQISNLDPEYTLKREETQQTISQPEAELEPSL